MIPIVTPAEMAAIDAAAPEPVEELIDRAGRAVALAAIRMLGGAYGRRVIVVAGPGNNGADGRVAAAHLGRRGVRCRVIEVSDFETEAGSIDGADLVIDAAFGTGLSRAFDFPLVAGGVPVLAVDIPSGVDGLTGETRGRVQPADLTITFAALKPGLLLEPGRALAGEVEVAGIGLFTDDSRRGLVEAGDARALLPTRPPDDHKWRSAVRIIGGSAGLAGAGTLAAAAAQRGGAGLVQLARPGGDHSADPVEAVAHSLAVSGWGDEATAGLDRIGAVAVGSGLGPAERSDLDVVLAVDRPLVVDGDALQPETVALLASRTAATVVTPHDGEWARLGGDTSGDRLGDTARFAAEVGVTVLRKGPVSIIAEPDGTVRVVAEGGPELATAGTGDVLAGLTVAFLGRGLGGGDAAVLAAWVHAQAGRVCGPGLVASDLVDALPGVFATMGETAT